MTKHTTIPDRYDVVVIGAGMGGLTSAAALARAGLSVCVLESDRRPGGYLAGFRRRAFRFDTAIHWLNQCGPSGLVRRVFDFLGPGAPETPPLRRIRRYKGDSFDYLLTDRPGELRDAFVRDFPADEAGIRAFFAVAERMGRCMERVGRASRTPASMTFWEKGRRMLPSGLAGLSLLRHSGPTEKLLPRYFRTEALRRVFCSEADFLSCVVPIGWAYTGDYQQPPAGGSQTFPQWLCALLEAWGATVAYRSRVSRILLDTERGRHRVAGVRVEESGRNAVGHRDVRCKYVVAACDLHTVYDRMLPAGAVKPALLRRLEVADLYDSSLTLSIGLDVPAGELGFDEEMICLTRDGIRREQHTEHDPDKVALSILAPSHRDPTLAPAGKGTLTVYAPARLTDADNWKTGDNLQRGAEYREYKQTFARALVERVEAAVAPGLTQHIEVLDVATPVTLNRYTGNRLGTIMAAKPTARNIFGRVAQYRTPIANLFAGGHWAEYGGGVPVAVRAGLNSALLILRQERPAEFEAVKGLLDGEGEVALMRHDEARTEVAGPGGSPT